MNNDSLKRTVLLAILGVISSLAHAMDFLTYLTFNQNDAENKTELLIIGAYPLTGININTLWALRDAKDFELLKSALDAWNNVDKIAFLLGSNRDIAQRNREIYQQEISRCKNGTSPYVSMFHTLPTYIEEKNKELSNITFNECDMCSISLVQTLGVLGVLRNTFSEMQKKSNIQIHYKTIQQSMEPFLTTALTVSAQQFLDELNNAATDIAKIFTSFDEITQKKLQYYAQYLQKKIPNLETFFTEQLNNDLEKSTLQAFVQYLVANSDHTTKPHESLFLLNNLIEQYTEIKNSITNAGYISALQKQKNTHKKIVMFLSIDRAVEIFKKYLKKYIKIGTARTDFVQGALKSRSASVLSHALVRNLLCVSFTKDVVSQEIPCLIAFANKFEKRTKPYKCEYCPAISIGKKFGCCSECKKIYYCTADCLNKDLPNHINFCKKQN